MFRLSHEQCGRWPQRLPLFQLSEDIQKTPTGDNLRPLVSLRKVLGVAGHEVIGFSGLRTFEKAIVGFIGTLSDRRRRVDENTLPPRPV